MAYLTSTSATPTTPTTTQERLLKYRDVMAICGISRAHLYNLAKRGDFPKPIKLSEKASAWLESEVQAWIADRVTASRG